MYCMHAQKVVSDIFKIYHRRLACSSCLLEVPAGIQRERRIQILYYHLLASPITGTLVATLTVTDMATSFAYSSTLVAGVDQKLRGRKS